MVGLYCLIMSEIQTFNRNCYLLIACTKLRARNREIKNKPEALLMAEFTKFAMPRIE